MKGPAEVALRLDDQQGNNKILSYMYVLVCFFFDVFVHRLALDEDFCFNFFFHVWLLAFFHMSALYTRVVESRLQVPFEIVNTTLEDLAPRPFFIYLSYKGTG
jgi:hypothetical protein